MTVFVIRGHSATFGNWEPLVVGTTASCGAPLLKEVIESFYTEDTKLPEIKDR